MHTKILIRTDSFSEHYQHWLQKDVRDVMEILSGSYANEVFGKGSEDLDYERTENFTRIIWAPDCLHHQTFGFLIDTLKTKLIAFAGYQLNISDERNEILDKGLRLTTHRHYLKPDPKRRGSQGIKCDLNFDNIMLEHRFNKDYDAFCITACHYKNTSPSTAFEKLMEFLLS